MLKKAIIGAALVAVFGLVFACVALAGQVQDIEDNMTESEDAKAMVKKDTFDESDYAAAYVDTLDTDFYMLLLGVDKDIDREQDEQYTEDAFRSDGIILAHVNTDEQKVALCSFERDIKIYLDGYGTCKLNNAYATGGIVGITQAVEELSDVDISHYAVVDMDGLVEIVDAVGGIDVYIEKPFYDENLDDGFDEAGWHTLDGAKALVYARSRYPWENGDYDRARHQRQVVMSLVDKISSETNPFAKTALMKTLSSHIATDLSVAQIRELAAKMGDMDLENSVHSMMTPATHEFVDGVSYQVLDDATWASMLAAFKALEDPSEVLSADGIDDTEYLSSTNKEVADIIQKRRGSADTEETLDSSSSKQ